MRLGACARCCRARRTGGLAQVREEDQEKDSEEALAAKARAKAMRTKEVWTPPPTPHHSYISLPQHFRNENMRCADAHESCGRASGWHLGWCGLLHAILFIPGTHFGSAFGTIAH